MNLWIPNFGLIYLILINVGDQFDGCQNLHFLIKFKR